MRTRAFDIAVRTWLAMGLLTGAARSAWPIEPLAPGSARLLDPVSMRFGSFTVAPAHTPLAVVTLRNTSKEPLQGKVSVQGPGSWLIVPAEQPISAPAGGTVRATFTVQRGTVAEANSYAMEARLTAADGTVVHRQNVVCASAPYFRPKIDGRTDDWKDAIPVHFVTGGKSTVISTYWNRRQFAVLVAVEEDSLAPWRVDASKEPGDAIQLAFSAEDKPTATSPDQRAGRYEFLLAATGTPQDGRWQARCFQLASPDTKLGATQQPREFAPLAAGQVEAVVSRNGKVTYYECAIPLKLLSELRAGEGREFCFSALVHDPDGTGIRDWGQAAGLWPSERNRLAWSDWPGACWGKQPPFDNRTPWGMCSSKY